MQSSALQQRGTAEGPTSTTPRTSAIVGPVKSSSTRSPFLSPWLAWFFTALLGLVAPSVAMLMFVGASDHSPVAIVSGPIIALALMGTGMIGSATVGRFWIGVLLAILSGCGLLLLADALGLISVRAPVATGFAILVASISFAARGTLFARSASEKGWWIALFVVAGEAAILITAALLPGALPGWLLALLPAQWASIALQTAHSSGDPVAASSALIALGGTATATLLVWWLWPRRWPYLIMFSVWLGLSALVYHNPAPPIPQPDTPTTPHRQAGEMGRANHRPALISSAEKLGVAQAAPQSVNDRNWGGERTIGAHGSD